MKNQKQVFTVCKTVNEHLSRDLRRRYDYFLESFVKSRLNTIILNK